MNAEFDQPPAGELPLSDIPSELQYTKSHEWIRRLPNQTIEMGITDHAQAALGDLVYVEVPEIGKRLAAGAVCAVVESVKAASDVYSPVAGVVVASNTALAERPELLNESPYTAGWLVRIELDTAASTPMLLDADAYARYVTASAD
jgi:glycine cleavage system H protein